MSKVLIIGCGGVAGVAIHKCCQNSEVFEEICIASRTKSKCDAVKAQLEGKTKTKITTEQVVPSSPRSSMTTSSRPLRAKRRTGSPASGTTAT